VVSDVTITVGEDDPYFAEGDISLTDDDGRELDLPYDVRLCRCGRSENQPIAARIRPTHAASSTSCSNRRCSEGAFYR
jgi:hypothetical protein